MLKPARILFLLAAVMAMAGCSKNFTAYALTSSSSIIQFDTSKPSTINSTVSITGLATGQTVVQMSYQPSSGTLYCVTNDGFLCTLVPATGIATIYVPPNGNTLPFTELLGSGNNTVRLTNPEMCFDPVSGGVRVISSQYNLLVDLNTGQVGINGTAGTNGTPVAFDGQDVNAKKTPQLAGIAYTNPVAGAGQTTLYALDVTTASLVRVGDNNTGSHGSVDGGDLRTIGALNAGLNGNSGFAISPNNGDAYAVLQNGGPTTLYTVSLDTGAVSSVGQVGGDNNSQIPTVIALVISR